MNIGIDARALSGRLTGDRTYWRGLIEGLSEIDTKNHYLLFVRYPLSSADRLALPENFKTVVVPSPSERIWSAFSFGKALREHGVDIAHVQYTVPPRLSCPVVTTVHDISFHLFPNLFSPKDRTLLNLSVPWSIRRADAVITVSESSRRDILKSYPFLSPEKITATPLAVSRLFKPLSMIERQKASVLLAERYDVVGSFVLSVGVLQPRKNLPLLIEAFVKAKEKLGFPHTLVVAGKAGWLSRDTETAIRNAGFAVKMTGYVADDDLPLLYGCADLTAYPSIYEGFGLPVLEAMACGCPVITSDNSSLPEVAGNAGILLPSNSAERWEETLTELIPDENRRAVLSNLGIERAKEFTWTKTAQKTLAVYQSIMSKD